MTFQPGISGNAKGRPPGIFHNYTVVAERLLERFSVTEILALASNHEEAEKSGLKPFEIAVLPRIANLFDRMDKKLASDEMERLLDRTIGKPKQSVDVQHSGGVAILSAGISEIKSWLSGVGAEIGSEDAGGNELVREERLVLPASVCPEKTVL